MRKQLDIPVLGREGLLDYTSRQISNLLPDGRDLQVRAVIDQYRDEAAQGVSVINRDVAPGCIVCAEGRELVQKPAKRRIH
ncbi:hypothetical protein [Pseudomonas sp. F3-2]|uniref:hypothetical protein n=1 Tax=Pseudomonas sp. F3-2 TaxID=3141539 RepID=UPI00315CAA6B